MSMKLSSMKKIRRVNVPEQPIQSDNAVIRIINNTFSAPCSGNSSNVADGTYPFRNEDQLSTSITDRQPPIIFNGYSISYRTVVFNGVTSSFWYLFPTTSSDSRVYMFYYSTSALAYLYQAVNPSNITTQYPTSQTTPLFKYAFVNNYGWSLITISPPSSTLGADPHPFTIVGYNYLFVAGVGYCYVPDGSIISPTPDNIDPSVKFLFSSYTYSYYDSSNVYHVKPYYNYDNSNVNVKLPYLTYDPYGSAGSIAQKTIPMDTHVGYLLPVSYSPYSLTISAQLAINKDCLSTLDTGNPYVEIYYQQSYENYVVTGTPTGPAGIISFTSADLIRDSSNNLVLNDGEYYLTVVKTNNTPLLISTDNNSLYGRRVITLRTDARFNVVNATVNIS